MQQMGENTNNRGFIKPKRISCDVHIRIQIKYFPHDNTMHIDIFMGVGGKKIIAC